MSSVGGRVVDSSRVASSRRNFAGMRESLRVSELIFCMTPRVGRGVGKGYFACHAGGREFESHLVHKLSDRVAVSRRASSSEDRAPNVPWPFVPVQQFFKRKKGGAKRNGKVERMEADVSSEGARRSGGTADRSAACRSWVSTAI